MSRIRVVPATAGHVDELHAGMRETDYEEVCAVAGHLTAHELRQRLAGALAALDEQGRVICLFGCRALPFRDDVGVPWMLGTDRLESYLVSMCREARRYVEEWQAQYALLTNATLEDNHVVIRWLKWLGFTFGYTFPAAARPDLTFIQFSRKRKPSCATPSPSPLHQ